MTDAELALQAAPPRRFPGRWLVVGWGAVAQAFVPHLLRHHGVAPEALQVWSPPDPALAEARAWGVHVHAQALTRDTPLDATLGTWLRPGDGLVNLAVGVCSRTLAVWCRDRGVHYLDTCVEPWAGGYTPAPGADAASVSNHALRAAVLAEHRPGAATGVIAHGANPGVVSHLVLHTLRRLGAQRGLDLSLGDAATAEALGLRVIHIAERDSQYRAAAGAPSRDTLVNTWSSTGLLAEAAQHAELGWGSHEHAAPPGSRRLGGADGPTLLLPGASVRWRARSWVPSVGEQAAWLITHHENTALAAHLSRRGEGGGRGYRPTVAYAYAPMAETAAALNAWAADGGKPPASGDVLRESLLGGHDELGALLLFDHGGAWVGSQLALAEAREHLPEANATTAQVVGGLIGAMAWMQDHPRRGLVEAEQMDATQVLEHALTCFGPVRWHDCHWRPEGGLALANFLLPAAARGARPPSPPLHPVDLETL